jgi:hypothetical protein
MTFNKFIQVIFRNKLIGNRFIFHASTSNFFKHWMSFILFVILCEILGAAGLRAGSCMINVYCYTGATSQQ